MHSSNPIHEIPMVESFSNHGNRPFSNWFFSGIGSFCFGQLAFFVSGCTNPNFFYRIIAFLFWYRKKRKKKRYRTTKRAKKNAFETILVMALAGISLGLHLIAWITSIYFTSIASASVLVTIHPILLILVEQIAF